MAKNKPKSENDSVFPTSFIFVNSNKKMLNLSQKKFALQFWTDTLLVFHRRHFKRCSSNYIFLYEMTQGIFFLSYDSCYIIILLISLTLDLLTNIIWCGRCPPSVLVLSGCTGPKTNIHWPLDAH